MSVTSGPYALTLNALQTVSTPATSATPPGAVQIQNASPFILNVTVDGAVQTLQSFTAQTFQTAGDGSPVTFVPTTGPAGSQGSATVVWLQPGEAPAMADGQLTGAAQYAQGLGSTLFDQSITTSPTYSSPPISLPPTVRTLVFTTPAGILSGAITNLFVIGVNSGLTFYNQAPYLYRTGGSTTFQMIVVPLFSLFDAEFSFVVTTGNNETFELRVFGDTAQYDESIFYNGVAVATSDQGNGAKGPLALVTGPCRLLSASVDASGGSVVVIARSTTAGTTNILRADSLGASGQEAAAIGFPPETIIPTGQSIEYQATAGTFWSANVVTAYP